MLFSFIQALGLLGLSEKSPVFGPAFTLYPLFQWYLQSNENFIKSQDEMVKLSISCTRFETNYSSCTHQSIENICRYDETQFSLPPKLMVFSVSTPLEC